MTYRGRFAPTPSGPLHAGSLQTALASYLQARAAGGCWLLRIDDLDQARCKPEYTDAILHQLQAHGLHWDERPRLQSQHVEEYARAYQRLLTRGVLYGCVCTRAQLAQTSQQGIDGSVYCGGCRSRAHSPALGAARIRVEDLNFCIDDRCHGKLHRQLASDVGDFIVRRADGQFAYQLACVVDESAQRISEVVRGTDLIGSSFRQRYLQQLLGLPTPGYLHVPLLLDARGIKLSKQNHAAAVDIANASQNLLSSLIMLGQTPPPRLASAGVAEILRWAVAAWDAYRLPKNLSPAEEIISMRSW